MYQKNKKEPDASDSLSFEWGKVDSNHRRRCQQIYSLSPLATREFPHIRCPLRNEYIIAHPCVFVNRFLKSFYPFCRKILRDFPAGTMACVPIRAVYTPPSPGISVTPERPAASSCSQLYRRNKKEPDASDSRSFEWGKVDSNHRRRCQQIYSLSPLATREFPQITVRTWHTVWSW